MYLIVILAAAVGQGGTASPTIEALVEANESYIGLIHEVEFEIDLEGERFTPNPVPSTHFATWHWAWRGPLERVRSVDLNVAPRDDGLPNNLIDVLRDGKESRVLRNWDPTRPQKITAARQGTVKATISPQTRNVQGRDVMQFLLWSHGLLVQPSERVSLRQLVDESAPPAELLGQAEVSGSACWQIRAHRPSAPGDEALGNQIDVYIDPSVNFAVRMADIRQTITVPAEDGKPSQDVVHMVREVLAFKDYGDGVFVPESVELRNYENGVDDAPASVIRGTVRSVRVNQPLSDDAFAFAFPENARVMHEPPVNGRRRVQLWGADNRPIKEIRGVEDIPLEPEEQSGDAWLSPTARAWLVILAIVNAVLIGFMFWRRAHRRRRSIVVTRGQ